MATASQAASPNTASLLRAGNATPTIELRGGGDTTQGLVFNCPDGERRTHVVRGLVLNGFSSYAIANNGCDGGSFRGNTIGVSASGQEPGPGSLGFGIAIFNAEDNAIGSMSPADRNVIAGATLANVYIGSTVSPTSASFRTFDNEVLNNFIGTNAAGDRGIGGSAPVSGFGVVIAGPGASPPGADPDPSTPQHERGNRIGYNIVAGHEEAGIWLSGGNDSTGAPVASASTFVFGNIIGHGTQATDFLMGLAPNEPPEPPASEPSLVNLGEGVLLGEESQGFTSNDNYFLENALLQNEAGLRNLGGTGNRADRNAVLRNRDAGIDSRDFALLHENSIWDNGALGISMQVDEADPQPWITLDAFTDGVIEGSFDLPIGLPQSFVCVETVIEIFASDTCDPSGRGEGRQFLESVTSDLCTGQFTYVPSELPFPRPQVTATATWTLGVNVGAGVLEVPFATSEFSDCVANDPPVVASPIADQTAEANTSLSFPVPLGTFVDPNGDTLVYSSTQSDGSPLPPWLTFDPQNGPLYFGTPGLSDVGAWPIRLTATDPSGASASEDFTITVVEPPPVIGLCGDPATLIHVVQGNGPVSPLVATQVIVEGIVVGDFQGPSALEGFFVQEEDTDADGDAATSEGLFVFDGRSGMDVSVGDRVRVGGIVTEYFGLTELTGLVGVQVCKKGVGGASPSSVMLPVGAVDDLEAFEGMLVTFPQELFATDSFDLGRFGEVDLSVGGRLVGPTQVVAPGPDAVALQELNDRSRILLDDGSDVQNPLPLPPYLGPDGTLRIGDATRDLTGVLSFGFGDYRIQPTGMVTFDRRNDRPAPPDVGGTIQVASFNVLNYFTTVDAGTPVCGPSGDQDCRGADSEAELERQRAKLVAALAAMDADVVGLVELENNPQASLEDLVLGVNGVAGPGTYDFVDTGTIGTDAIKVGLIYKPATVLPTGSTAVLDDVFPFNANTRPALAQSFEEVATGQVLTVVVNHFKSKGSACDAVPNPDTGTDFIDPDAGDGQGNCNLTRVEAANRLLEWLGSDPTATGGERTLVLGDLNAYAQEDPLQVFEAAGYVNLLRKTAGDESYSYVFDGQAGTFDYVLASPGVPPLVTGVAAWHVDADEPRALDYNDFNQPALFQPDPYRASDHDPLVAGLDLQPMISVGLDIKPFFARNPIFPTTRIPLPVAILAGESFDPRDVDPDTVRFGPAGASPRFRPFFFDVNRDARKDLILFFTSRDTGIPCGATSASLVGFTFDGTKIEGSDAVWTLFCRAPPPE